MGDRRYAGVTSGAWETDFKGRQGNAGQTLKLMLCLQKYHR